MALEVDIKKQLNGFTLNVAFTADSGVTALLGASGSGKSMTLRCIAGVERPDSGRIVLDGQILYDSEKKINLPPQKRHVGYLFQRYALFPNMTVLQNIGAGLSLEKDASVRKDKQASLLKRFHLEGLEARYPRELSGGQMQRVALCRMLAGEPEAILLDEPFAALDSYLRWQLEREVRNTLSEFSGVSLLVSHDRGEVYRMSGRVCVLSAGTSEPVVDTSDLFERPKTLQSALISGCKNCASAKLSAPETAWIPDWNLELSCIPVGTKTITHVGVRAHYILPCAPETENAVLCRIVDITDDVFSRILTLLPPGAVTPLRSELSRERSRNFKIGETVYFSLPREAVMLLGDADENEKGDFNSSD